MTRNKLVQDIKKEKTNLKREVDKVIDGEEDNAQADIGKL